MSLAFFPLFRSNVSDSQYPRHVALLQIQGKEFHMDPIPLRTVRPFVIDEVFLIEAAEEEGFDVTDQIEVGKFLRAKASSLLSCSWTC